MPIKSYAGVGSRRTPEDVLDLMTRIAAYMRDRGWVLRSGAADGADTAFARGAGDRKEIYLPWEGFNGYGGDCARHQPSIAALRMAPAFHPIWDRLSLRARLLHARNCHQVLGTDLDDPVRLVVCWTPDGATTGAAGGPATGGTGTAIRIADAHTIRILNLRRPDHRARVERKIAGDESRPPGH